MSILRTNQITNTAGTGSPIIPGCVLQVIQGGRTSRTTVSATTYTDIGVSASITPKSTTSKILVTVSGMLSNSTNNGYYSLLKLFRDNTEIGSGTGGTYNSFVAHLMTANYETNGFSQQHLDSPNSTLAITYSLKLAAQSGSVATVGGRGDNNNAHAVPTTITLMEIGG